MKTRKKRVYVNARFVFRMRWRSAGIVMTGRTEVLNEYPLGRLGEQLVLTTIRGMHVSKVSVGKIG